MQDGGHGPQAAVQCQHGTQELNCRVAESESESEAPWCPADGTAWMVTWLTGIGRERLSSLPGYSISQDLKVRARVPACPGTDARTHGGLCQADGFDGSGALEPEGARWSARLAL